MELSVVLRGGTGVRTQAGRVGEPVLNLGPPYGYMDHTQRRRVGPWAHTHTPPHAHNESKSTSMYVGKRASKVIDRRIDDESVFSCE